MPSQSRRIPQDQGPTIEVPIAGLPQVKALTFETLAGVLPRRFDAAKLVEIRAALSGPTREVLDVQQPGGWVDEVQMEELLGVVYELGLNREDPAFSEFCRDVALEGIGRFMKIFLSLASARFVLRRIPVVWKRLRRSAGAVTVEPSADFIRLHYVDFPFFGNHLYRLLSIANCQALVQAATGAAPPGRQVSWTETTLSLEFDVRALRAARR